MDYSHDTHEFTRWSALLRNKPKNTPQKKRTDVLLLILMSWVFILIRLHASNNLWSKLLVQRVCVWGRFHITLPFYTLSRGAWHNWDRFVTATAVFIVGFTVRIPWVDEFKIYILCSARWTQIHNTANSPRRTLLARTFSLDPRRSSSNYYDCSKSRLQINHE